MSRLTKTIAHIYKAAFPGYEGYPGYPGNDEYWTQECITARAFTTGTYYPVNVAGYDSSGYTYSYTTTKDVYTMDAGGYVYKTAAAPYSTITTSTGNIITVANPGFEGQTLLAKESKELTVVGHQPSGSLVLGPSPYTYQMGSAYIEGSCRSVYHPARAPIPPIPPMPPTPAEFSQDFQEGWNSSAQAVTGLLPGKAAAFTIMNGTRGLLAGVEPASWTPNINTARYGIMFNAGGFTGYPSNVTAVVWENGVLKQQLGTFINGQTFLIGRATNNRIVFRNVTQSIQVITATTPAPATVPMHLFSQMYLGGDTIYA